MGNPKKELAAKRRYWLKKYGLTLETYQALLQTQNYCCKICGRSNNSNGTKKSVRLVVDHDHKTGRVRGLLCTNCNLLLGNAYDSQEILAKAIEYLKD